MFRSEFRHTIDAKGRLIIPAKYRELLGEQFILTRGLDNCLWAYPMKEWEIFEEKLKGLQLTKVEARAFVRFFSSGATECTFDPQGRILIPPALRQYAQLDREVVVTGVITRVEIWNKATWDQYMSSISPEALASNLADLGI